MKSYKVTRSYNRSHWNIRGYRICNFVTSMCKNSAGSVFCSPEGKSIAKRTGHIHSDYCGYKVTNHLTLCVARKLGVTFCNFVTFDISSLVRRVPKCLKA